MSSSKVSIVGAGIGGLALGRCLLQRGIRATIYEKDSAKAFQGRYNYAVMLHPWAYEALVKNLSLSKDEFAAQVDVYQDGNPPGPGSSRKRMNGQDTIHANRNRLEQLLSQGLSIQWERRPQEVKFTSDGPILDLGDSKEEPASEIIVGTDGPHSIVRGVVSPQAAFKILPFAVYNGKRRINRAALEKSGCSEFLNSPVLEQRHGSHLLKISFDDVGVETISVSWTYSRPPLQGTETDELYRPHRAKEDARQIPEKLFSEISELHLEKEFAYIFDPSQMRQDRLLNWLMRSMLVPKEDLQAAASQGMVLMGDSAHSTPILGGDGANQAIMDAIELTEVVAGGNLEDLSAFYDTCHSRWRDSVKSSEKRLKDMHMCVFASL